MPINEATIMRPNTGVPTSRRASSEAPVAITSGNRPRMKANEVIITGRNRSRTKAAVNNQGLTRNHGQGFPGAPRSVA